jgi:hypothetical protein
LIWSTIVLCGSGVSSQFRNAYSSSLFLLSAGMPRYAALPANGGSICSSFT